jgi:hypothetical protein
MNADGPWIKDLTDFESLPQKLQNRTFRDFAALRFVVLPRTFLPWGMTGSFLVKVFLT